jgi:hypothetical protein
VSARSMALLSTLPLRPPGAAADDADNSNSNARDPHGHRGRSAMTRHRFAARLIAVNAVCSKCGDAYTKEHHSQHLCYGCGAATRTPRRVPRRERTMPARPIVRPDFLLAFPAMKAELDRQVAEAAGQGAHIPLLRKAYD